MNLTGNMVKWDSSAPSACGYADYPFNKHETSFPHLAFPSVHGKSPVSGHFGVLEAIFINPFTPESAKWHL